MEALLIIIPACGVALVVVLIAIGLVLISIKKSLDEIAEKMEHLTRNMPNTL